MPCPCARGGFAKGTCGVDAAKQAAGNVPDEFLGVCECQEGYTGRDCTISCPPCATGDGDCVPPLGLEAGIGEALNVILVDPTLGTDEDRGAALAAVFATGVGVCECRAAQGNVLGGTGFAGDDCSVACLPCDKGTCRDDGTCACLPGYAGARCDAECSGHGVMRFPVFNETYNATVFDALPGVEGNADTASSGLFDVARLYGVVGVNSTLAYCACGWARTPAGEAVPMAASQMSVNPLGGVGWTGVFCEVPCDRCNEETGRCVFDGVAGVCECVSDMPNSATSASALLPVGETGVGYTGPACEIPCQPCYNGTCSAIEGSYGECLCDPGYADAACLIECGSPGFATTPLGNVSVGSRGRVNLTAAAPGRGLLGTTAACACDYMWTGPLCSHPCPYPYDEDHGMCVVKDPSDDDYGDPWTTEIVCEEGWTGLPEPSLRLAAGASSRGRNCSTPCLPCVHGTCQDDGTCLCDYGYIWQGPLGAELEEAATVAAANGLGQTVVAVTPFPALNDGRGAATGYDAAYHTCGARHPCNANGEYLNASCGRFGNGTMDNLTEWRVVDLSREDGGGWGCTGTVVNGSVCVGGEARFAMAYALWDPVSRVYARTSRDIRAFNNWGGIQGGYCEVEDDELNDGQPLHGGYCVCDSIRNLRFQHPSAASRSEGSYDYYFQGWAGASCEIPCAPCSKNGLCNAETGACDCFDGWAGFRCLTPCEPCDHGTCQYDGTCLCDGARQGCAEYPGATEAPCFSFLVGAALDARCSMNVE